MGKVVPLEYHRKHVDGLLALLSQKNTEIAQLRRQLELGKVVRPSRRKSQGGAK